MGTCLPTPQRPRDERSPANAASFDRPRDRVGRSAAAPGAAIPGRRCGSATSGWPRYHEFTRRKGVNWPLYTVARPAPRPFFLIYFRLSRAGRSYARQKGALIVAANHRSFLDPFVISAILPFRRPMTLRRQGRAVREALAGLDPEPARRLSGLPRRGRRGHRRRRRWRCSRRGGVVCIFPEGTRIRSGSLAPPHRGVGRLALETGAAVLPVAVLGTEHVRNGWWIRPRKVKVRAGKALTFPRTENPSPQLAATVTARIWPNVELQWEWLGGLPPMRKAAVIGAGSYGTAVAVLLARAGLDVQLGPAPPNHAAELAADRENRQYLPDIQLGEGIHGSQARADIEVAGLDLVCLAVPSAALPAAVAEIGDRIGERTAVLLLSKGLVPPIGTLPSVYVGDRVRARALATLGGPAHAKEAALGTAALVLASADDDLRAQLGDALRPLRPGLRAHRDVDRRRDGRRRQERRRARRRGGREPRAQRGRHRGGRDLA